MKSILRCIVWILIFNVCLKQSFGQKVVYFKFNEPSGTTTSQEDITGLDFSIVNNFSKPERIAGVESSALRLDGWSTWVTNSTFQIPNITDKFLLEAWHVTESFTADFAGIISQEDASVGFSLAVGRFGTVKFTFTANNSRYSLESTQRLKPYQWNHIVAFADLENQVAKIFVNGEEWASKTLPIHTMLSFASQTLFIGRHSSTHMEAGFPVTVLNGALDELSIYKSILTIDQIQQNYQQYAAVQANLSIDPEVRHGDDHLRPRYHSMPNTSWTNEPYGLIFFEGKYHLFFQKNPNGPYLYFMHWGHLSSPDLVNWTEEKIAIRPDPGFDDFGTWSGTTIKDNTGIPKILYTGVNGFKAGIGLATPKDNELIEWTKSVNNPLIPNPPAGYMHMDFRDPYVWKVGSMYYMIVGSGISNNGGGILFTYRSTDLVNWSAIVPLFRDTNTARAGFFWEMPSFLQLNEKTWMLQVTPLFQGQRARSLYWLGEFANERFIPYSETPQNFELFTENLLAPAVGVDENSIPIYIGIVVEDRSDVDQIKAGWRQTFSIPREIRMLEDSTMGHIPHRNLCRLRAEHIQIKDRSLLPGTGFNLPELGGNQTELKFSIKADSAAVFSIQLFKHPDAAEFTSLVFDLEKNEVALDKRFSTFSNALKTFRKTDYRFDFKEPVNVHLFLDHSILEVFIDQVLVYSTRVYPSRIESQKVDLVVNKKAVKILQVDQWQLHSMNESSNTDICVPENLPTSLRYEEPEVVVPVGIEQNRLKGASIYPVPAKNELTVEVKDRHLMLTTFSILSLNGQTLLEADVLESTQKVNIAFLKPGIYLGVLQMGGASQHYRIVIQ